MIDVTAAKRKEKRKSRWVEEVGDDRPFPYKLQLGIRKDDQKGERPRQRLVTRSMNVQQAYYKSARFTLYVNVLKRDARHDRGLFSQGRIESR
ncbi:hypothetical protein V1477_008860 [Vespula maculifrons]|uniref:Uncharacterized protein n=1 Tax=Vespula maculifrons TaxID=7453 RepID=A0ABD2CE87_VESMC